MSVYPSRDYPIFPPHKSGGVANIRLASEPFVRPGNPLPPEQLAKNVFNDPELANAVIRYIERYNLAAGYAGDPKYAYRVIFTVAVLAQTARDNADGRYSLLFDTLWDWEGKRNNYRPKGASNPMILSEYMNFIKENNLFVIAKKFMELPDSVKVADNISVRINYDPRNKAPDDRFKYVLTISGTMTQHGKRVPFVISSHTSGRNVNRIAEELNVPIADEPSFARPIDPTTKAELRPFRHEALKAYIPQDTIAERAYRDVKEKSPFQRADRSADTSPLIDFTKAPHTQMESDPELQAIPFPEFIGLLKHGSDLTAGAASVASIRAHTDMMGQNRDRRNQQSRSLPSGKVVRVSEFSPNKNPFSFQDSVYLGLLAGKGIDILTKIQVPQSYVRRGYTGIREYIVDATQGRHAENYVLFASPYLMDVNPVSPYPAPYETLVLDREFPAPLNLTADVFQAVPPKNLTLEGLKRRGQLARVVLTHPSRAIRLNGIYGYPNFLHQI